MKSSIVLSLFIIGCGSGESISYTGGMGGVNETGGVSNLGTGSDVGVGGTVNNTGGETSTGGTIGTGGSVVGNGEPGSVCNTTDDCNDNYVCGGNTNKPNTAAPIGAIGKDQTTWESYELFDDGKLNICSDGCIERVYGAMIDFFCSDQVGYNHLYTCSNGTPNQEILLKGENCKVSNKGSVVSYCCNN